MSQYDMNVHDYFRIIRKRKWIIILTTLAVYIAAIVYTKMQTKLYKSTATVTIRTNEAQSSQFMGNELGTGIDNKFNNSSQSLETAEKIIKSRSVALRVINELGLADRDATPQAVNRLIDSMTRRINVNVNKETKIITISLDSGEPVKATRIVNALAEAFRIESEKQAQYSEQVLMEYLKEQLEIAKERMKQSETELLNFKSAHKIELTNKSALTPENIEQLETELSEVIDKRQYYENQISLLQQKLNGQNVDIARITVLNNDPEIKSINDEIKTAQKQLDEFTQKYMPSHPKIYVLKNKISKLQEQLEVVLDKKINIILTQLDEEITDLYNKESSLKQQIALYKTKMNNLPKIELDMKKLERAYVVSDELYTMFKQKLEQAKLRSASKVGDVRIVNPASVPEEPFYPNERQSALAGLVIGLILGFAFAFIVESMDTSIGTIEDVEKYIQKTVLGVIPHIKIDSEKVRKLRKRIESAGEVFNERQARLVSICDPKSPVTEAYRTLRTNLQFALPNKTGCNTILLSSATPQEGKSTSLTNLAVILAQAGKKTLIMSCNLRHPSVYKIFGVKKKPGITDILAGTISWREAVQDPGIDNLNILSAGPYPPNPSEILQSQEFDELVAELKQEFDVILFDSPPILPVTDGAIIASKVDAVVLVYFVGKAAREALMRTKIQLNNVNANIVGIILNDIKAEGKLAYTYYYHYQYKYYGVRDANEL